MKREITSSRVLASDRPLPPGVVPASALVLPGILPDAHGRVTAQLRIIGQQYCLSKQGSPYTRLYLGNAEGSIVAIVWHDRFLPSQRIFEHGQVLAFSGKMLTHKGREFLNIQQVEAVDAEALSPSGLMPTEWVLPKRRGSLNILLQCWDDIQNRYVRAFLAAVFSDTANAMGLLNSPAAKRYHHARQGGLLQHTAEMLSGLRHTPLYQTRCLERDLAITLVVIHDLGKTVTLVGNRYNVRGDHQPHEMAVLELVAEPLRQLETHLPVAANQIRGYFKPSGWFPVQNSRLYTLVSRLDRDSAQRNHALTNAQ